MSRYVMSLEGGNVRFLCVLPDPVERVWAYLTEPELRGRWLAAGPVGSIFRRTGPAKDGCWGYEETRIGSGRITRCDPPHRLSCTWTDHERGNAQITFELMPRHGTVILLLTQCGFDDHAAMVRAARGWHTCLGLLADHLYGREPRPICEADADLEADSVQRLAMVGSTLGAVRSGPTWPTPSRLIPGTSTAPQHLPGHDNEDCAPLLLPGCHSAAPRFWHAATAR